MTVPLRILSLVLSATLCCCAGMTLVLLSTRL